MGDNFITRKYGCGVVKVELDLEYVAHYTTNGVITVPYDTPCHEMGKIMSEMSVGCLLVTKEEQPVGIITEKDLISKVIAKNFCPDKVLAKDIMSEPLITISPTSTIKSAVNKMLKNGINHLVVMDEGAILGIFSLKNLLQTESPS